MKLIFMGTPEFAVPTLDRVLADNYDVAAVFTQPDKPAGRGKHLHHPPVKTLAIERGIPVHQPAKIRNTDEARIVFETIAPDACVVAAYGKILPESLLGIPRLGCINVHASLLPKYRGAAPINWAIANGESNTGVTIMRMDAGMDTGPMLAKRATEIGPDETAPELSARLAEIGAQLLSETLRRVERGDAVGECQDDAEASYAPMLRREDGLIDWSEPARRIANRVRAFQPWPGSYSSFRGRHILIWRARADDPGSSEIHGPPGAVTKLTEQGLVVASGEGTLLVEELQVEGKRRMPARDFVNGLRLQVGERFF